MSAIGYRECIGVVQGSMTLDQAKVEMRRGTRVFVRRQGNWFKESDPQIRWFDPSQNRIEEIESFLRISLENKVL
jgi:tRNA dimethylallyltransferase